jgi:hypothetical protein
VADGPTSVPGDHHRPQVNDEGSRIITAACQGGSGPKLTGRGVVHGREEAMKVRTPRSPRTSGRPTASRTNAAPAVANASTVLPRVVAAAFGHFMSM